MTQELAAADSGTEFGTGGRCNSGVRAGRERMQVALLQQPGTRQRQR